MTDAHLSVCAFACSFIINSAQRTMLFFGAGQHHLCLNLHPVDVQLLDQLCSLGLKFGALREALDTILEEEGESSEEEEEEEDEESQGKLEEGQQRTSCPAPRLPDFEMTI
ncbi:hypothetical protein TREES_T100011479 [Tupaia chinensis]|uniref:Uncharacterized protein n=1 Tax=Tupaia chinensis TaxID=246437 RepID=L9L7G1_TUPCH|nr:hypothetical protein TREES_T100011479 [Tupaia chinensis]